MRVLLVGDDANDQNLLQKGRPFIMRLPGASMRFVYFFVVTLAVTVAAMQHKYGGYFASEICQLHYCIRCCTEFLRAVSK
jgi:hypothetical protein